MDLGLLFYDVEGSICRAVIDENYLEFRRGGVESLNKEETRESSAKKMGRLSRSLKHGTTIEIVAGRVAMSISRSSESSV